MVVVDDEDEEMVVVVEELRRMKRWLCIELVSLFIYCRSYMFWLC
jgi:hypothetical protein